uniref:Uncharacterized protein n=1 Tax=Rhabditophanes sp. KR3021 TaxID=114890 RepID=A0AC35U9M5_9BILA
MIQGFQPPRQMIMPPPPDYDKSATSRRTKRVPSSSRRAGAFNDSYEHDESIYEEPQTPPLPKKHPKQTPAPRKHIETLSKQAESITPNQSRRDYRYNYPPTTQPHPQTSAMRQAGFVDSSNPGMNAQMNAWRAINYGYPPQQHPNTQFQFTSPPSGQRRFY